MKIKGFLLDLDGVVFKNSLSLAARFIYEYINKISNISFETVKTLIRVFNSFPPEECFNFLFSSLGIREYLSDFSDKMSHFEDNKGIQVKIDDDFKIFIDHCAKNGVTYKIFSLAPVDRIQKALPFIGRDDIYSLKGKSKADPKTFHILGRELCINPAGWALIDDDPFSLRTAKISGMITIMMMNEIFNEPDYHLYRDFIDHKVFRFKEILQMYFIEDHSSLSRLLYK